MKYDIFISYKRLPLSSAKASYIYESLTKKGYNVFFDRKEMKSGNFNEQLYRNIEDATDILILIEENSLNSCFSQIEGAYKTDWFCKEIIHALNLTTNKNILPIYVDKTKEYTEKSGLPSDMKKFPVLEAKRFDDSDVEKFYEETLKKNLKSTPKNLALIRQQQSNGQQIGTFLFYTNGSFCDLYEFGEIIAHLTDDNDEDHPFSCPAYFAGEHRFKVKNAKSCEEITLNRTIQQGYQEWVSIEWKDKTNIWKLKAEEIQDEDDDEKLYKWGLNFFYGTSVHEPDIRRAAICLEKAGLKDKHVESRKFLATAYLHLIDTVEDNDKLIHWIKNAIDVGNKDAIYNFGFLYETGKGTIEKDLPKALAYYKKGAKKGGPRSLMKLAGIYKEEKNEFGVKADRNTAEEYYKKCAELTDADNREAQFELSKMYHEDYEAKVKEAQANGKDAESCKDLLCKALYWLNKAASAEYEPAVKKLKEITTYDTKGNNEDFRKAKSLLSEVYINLAHDEKDELAKRNWLNEAANLGNEEAMYQLGLLSSYTMKISWFKKAADKNHIEAINEIIHYYEHNFTDEITHEFYAELLPRAAEELNIKTAQYYLGQKYMFGSRKLDIEENQSKAFELLYKSYYEPKTYTVKATKEGGEDETKEEKESKALIALMLCYFLGWGTRRNWINSLKCFYHSIIDKVLLKSIYELVETFFESGTRKLDQFNDWMKRHSRLVTWIQKTLKKFFKFFKGSLTKRLGNDRVSSLFDVLDKKE